MKKFFKPLLAAMALVFHRAEFTNVAEGFHRDGSITRTADAATATLYLVTTTGSDAAHFAIAGASDVPQGICQDIVGVGFVTKVLLLGKGPTKIAQGSAAIAAGDRVTVAAAGQCQTMNGITNGTYYCIGQALTACAGAGEQFEIVDCFPFQVTVSA